MLVGELLLNDFKDSVYKFVGDVEKFGNGWMIVCFDLGENFKEWIKV